MMTVEMYVNGVVAGLVEQGYDVEVSEVQKVNKVLTGLTLNNGNKIRPTVYPEQLLNNGCSINDAIAKIIDVFNTKSPNVDVDEIVNLTDHSKIRMCVINTERNKQKLENIPHRELCDLSICYKYVLSNTEDGMETIQINNQLMESSGLTESELFELSKANEEITIGDMFTVMMGLIADDTDLSLDNFGINPELDEQMYVVSNKEKTNGACAIVNGDALKKVANILDSDLYILPSSIHELICVPTNIGQSEQELVNMVREVNATQLEENEFLSDNIYRFNRQEETLNLIFLV